MPTKNPDVKQQVKEIALSFGVDEEKATQLAEKCYSDIMWRPYGGAKSFAEVDEMRSAQEFASKVNMETYTLESIIGNIVYDEESSADDRADAIKNAADDYRKRVNSMSPEARKSMLDSIKSFIFGEEDKTIRKVGNKYVLYSHSGKRLGEFDSREAAEKRERQINFFKHQDKEAVIGKGFKVYVDSSGNPRWISSSSNAFEDHDKELFTTKALQEAIEYADKSGERGPLLVYHVPSAEIGQCDFQAMAGRFLIESGTFDDTPLGQKALEYYVTTDEEQQVSIGYEYRIGDEDDGQYDWLRFKERSVLPYGTAANPWTSFKIIGEEKMDANKAAEMKKVFGEEFAQGVIDQYEAASKELEKTVRFKEKKPEVANSLSNIATLVKSLPDGDIKKQLESDYGVLVKAMDKDEEEEEDEDKKKEEAGKKEEQLPDGKTAELILNADQMTQLGQIIGDLTAKVDVLATIPAAVIELDKQIKELKKSDDEKIADTIAPRWNGFNNQRPSSDNSNVITEEKVKELVGTIAGAGDMEDPSVKYVRQIIPGFGQNENGV